MRCFLCFCWHDSRVPFIHIAILLLTSSQITAAMLLCSGITVDGKGCREPYGGSDDVRAWALTVYSVRKFAQVC